MEKQMAEVMKVMSHGRHLSHARAPSARGPRRPKAASPLTSSSGLKPLSPNPGSGERGHLAGKSLAQTPSPKLSSLTPSPDPAQVSEDISAVNARYQGQIEQLKKEQLSAEAERREGGMGKALSVASAASVPFKFYGKGSQVLERKALI